MDETPNEDSFAIIMEQIELEQIKSRPTPAQRHLMYKLGKAKWLVRKTKSRSAASKLIQSGLEDMKVANPRVEVDSNK